MDVQFFDMKLPHLAGFVFSRNRGVWQLSETVVPYAAGVLEWTRNKTKMLKRRMKCDLSEESMMVNAKSVLAKPHFLPSIWYD